MKLKPTICIQEMISELEEAGWTRYHGNSTMWVSPRGNFIYRGPARAHEVMLRLKEINEAAAMFE